MQTLQFFNPYADIRETENRLPHWQQVGAVYFVTFRLGDAVPYRLHTQWEYDRKAWLCYHPEPWALEIKREYDERFSRVMEDWLDAGLGSCLLRQPSCAKLVAETLEYFENVRVTMISYVVMPNHVHALFVQNPEWTLEKIMQSWKRFSAREINKLRERAGKFWQRDYFDRLVRDEQHFANCVRYIRRNPQKARLNPNEYVLCESEMARSISSEARTI
jgi:putative transposase